MADIKLRPYQQAAINSIFEWFENNSGNPLCVMATGTGKSVCIADFIRDVQQTWPDQRIVVAVDVKELVAQNYAKLIQMWPDASAGIYSAGLGKKQLHQKTLFVGIQSVYDKAYKIQRCDLLLADECFTGETLIETLNGKKRIDCVRLGDIIYNATGCGEVTGLFKKTSNIIYNVRLSNGIKIRCTGNHPFLSEYGWIEARNLEKGQGLIGIQNMQELWQEFSTLGDGKINSTRATFQKAKILWEILLKEDGKSDVEIGRKRKNDKIFKKDRTQAIYSWWKWQRHDKATNNDIGNNGYWLETRIGNTNENAKSIKKLSNVLQSGFGKSISKESNRIGWKFSLWQKSRTRQKERQPSDFIRVENIEIEEFGRGEFVYNLQVNGHPSYFANGILVHNCHMISEKDSGMWRQFITDLKTINPDMKVIGFTATEARMDSGLLHTGDQRMFDGICYRYGIKEALDDGYLVEIIPKSMTTKVDMTGVKKRGGDYIESEQGKRWNIDDITKSAVAEILEYAAHRKSVMVFSSGVDHAEAICAELIANGQTAAIVTGETPDGERDRMLSAFKKMEIKFIVNNAVLTKGFDAPHVDLIAVLRKTLSPVLWLQILGRGTRTVVDLSMYDTKEERIEAILASSKPNCLLLDFGGNTRHFGAIDQIVFKDKGEAGDGIPPMKDCEKCHTLIFAGCRTCPAPPAHGLEGVLNESGKLVCGFEFPEPERKIESTASNAAIISSQIAKEEKAVMDVRYDYHEGKAGKKPTLKVTYKIDLKEQYSEWICLEHEGFPREKAARWWRERFDYAAFPDLQNVPRDVNEALGMVVALKRPSRIWVVPEGKFFRITNYDFVQLLEVAPPPVHVWQQQLDNDDDMEIPF